MRSFNGGTPSAFTSLRFKDCSSKVIFGKILLIPVFHHRRLAEMFGKILLSLSSLLLIKTQNYYKKKPDNSQEVPGLFCRFSFYLYIEKNNTNRCCLSFHLYFLYLQNCIQRIILFFPITLLGYALDLLVTVSSMCYHTSTSALSTSSSSRGLTNLTLWDISS